MTFMPLIFSVKRRLRMFPCRMLSFSPPGSGVCVNVQRIRVYMSGTQKPWARHQEKTGGCLLWIFVSRTFELYFVKSVMLMGFGVFIHGKKKKISTSCCIGVVYSRCNENKANGQGCSAMIDKKSHGHSQHHDTQTWWTTDGNILQEPKESVLSCYLRNPNHLHQRSLARSSLEQSTRGLDLLLSLTPNSQITFGFSFNVGHLQSFLCWFTVSRAQFGSIVFKIH